MLGHVISRVATELSNKKRSSFTKPVTTEKFWSFELGVGNGNDVPVYVKVGFKQRGQFNQQRQNNDTLFRPSAVNDQCFIGNEMYTDSRINCN